MSEPIPAIPSELAKIFKEIEDVSEFLKERVRHHGNAGVTKGSDADRAAMILTFRCIKFLDAYLPVAKAGYREPSATLVRALYETFLWTRWAILGNATEYLASGRKRARDIAVVLKKHGVLNPEIESIANEPRHKPPPWAMLAEVCDMVVMHETIYPHLCNLSHGNMYGAIDVENARVTFGPDFFNVDKEAAIARRIAAEHCFMVETWWSTGKVAPAPRWSNDPD